LRKVNDVALELRRFAHAQINEYFDQLGETVSEIDRATIYIDEGGPDRNNSHWYRVEVIQSARDAGKFANLSENHYFIKATMRVARERLVFVVSFHHVGRELSGVMEATCFARLESFDDSEDGRYRGRIPETSFGRVLTPP